MEEKSCKNCKHYRQHYVRHGTRIGTVSCGHCINKKHGGHYRKTDEICECFEDKTLQDIKVRESIFKILESMRERLNDITSILKKYK